MRIISGKHKGRRIIAPKKLPVRPTTDMAKEGLFNILSNRFSLEHLTVLDLFAGTGNMSFEFASRGALSVTAVDAHPRCVQFIQKMAKELEMGINVIRSDVFKFLKGTTGQYDIIFADPPYDMDLSQFMQLPNIIFEHSLLKENGILIIEHASHMDLKSSPYFLEMRKYGSSVFSFFTADTT